MIPIRDRLPTRTVPYVNYALIVANVVAFLLEYALINAGYVRLIVDWGFVPARFLEDPIGDMGTVLTAMFLHGGWLHIGGNMLFLWVFGDNVEDALGHGRYLAFYVLGGLLAALAQAAVDPMSTVPMVGASGAIAAVLAAYVSLYPRARVLVLFPIFILVTFLEFPAWLVVLEWFALQLLSGIGSISLDSDGGTAWFAHIGGFLAGLFLVRFFMAHRSRQSYDAWSSWTPHAPRRRSVRQRRDDWN